MIKKFTEEQYQRIVQLQKDDFEPTILSVARTNNENFWGNLGLFREDIRDFVFDNDLYEELAAIANPLTREWAHDKFVEKEKRYVWRSKITNSIGKEKRLYDTADGISDSFIDKDTPSHNGNRITETEIKKWGYNPEEFYKAEV